MTIIGWLSGLVLGFGAGWLLGEWLERLGWNKLINRGVLVFAPKEQLPYLVQRQEMWARNRTEENVPPEPQVCSHCGGYYWAECPCTGHERIDG